MDGHGTGFESPEVVIDGADGNQIMVGPCTFAAEDTLAEIPYNKGIGLLQARIMRHGVEIYGAHSQVGRDLPQVTSVALAAEDTGFGVVGHHEADDIGAVILYVRRVRPDNHVRGNGCDTGCQNAPAFFIFNKTKSACTGRFQVGVIAESRNLDAVFKSCSQNAGTGRATDILPVYGEAYLFQILSPPHRISSVSKFQSAVRLIGIPL